MAANNKKIFFSHFTPSQTRRCKKFVEINKAVQIETRPLKAPFEKTKGPSQDNKSVKASVNSYHYLTSPKSGVKS